MAGRLKLRPLNITKISPRCIALFITLTVFALTILRLLYSKSGTAPGTIRGLARTVETNLDNPRAVETKSQKLLELLYQDLFRETNRTLQCEELSECVSKRKQAVDASCFERGAAPRVGWYSGSHNTHYYYTVDIEVCSGNEENLLDTLTFEVPTVQVINVPENGMTKVLHIDNPLLRLYKYYQAVRSGIGYLYLGEEIVYKFRDVEFSDIWKLPAIYEARLGLLWEREGSVNPFENPFGPTLLEFMVYLVDVGTLNPSSWAPTVHNCHACHKQYHWVVRQEKELQCLYHSYFAGDGQVITHDIKIDIYNSFRSLPASILAHLYEIYAADLNSFVC